MTRRLLLSYLAVTMIVLAVLEIPLGVVYSQREREQFSADAERDATVLATIYEDSLEHGDPFDVTAAADYAARTDARVLVVDADGISVLDTDAETPIDRDYSTRPEFVAALEGGRATGTRFSETLDTDLFYVAVPVASGGNVWGGVRITLDAGEVDARVQRFWLGLAGVALVVLAAMTGIGFAIARSVTRPVRRLQAAAARFAEGELESIEPDTSAPRELRELQDALNSMASQLGELLQQQRAFVADASHQLRTPLTAIRLRLENLASAATEAATEDEIEAAIAETTRLGTLVEDLLKLARAERYPDPSPVPLTAATRERVDLWTAVAEQQRVSIQLDAPRQALAVAAVADGVEQILDNLLDNAIAASPPDAVVTVTLAAGEGTNTLVVADQGPGLTDDDKARAFDRFWRGRTEQPGTGLGLAIVAALTTASRGTIELADNRPSGLVVTITLPSVDPRLASGPSQPVATTSPGS